MTELQPVNGLSAIGLEPRSDVRPERAPTWDRDLSRRLGSGSLLEAHGRSIPNAVWILMLSALAARLAVVLLSGQWDATTALENASIAEGLLADNGFAHNETADYTQFGRYEPTSVQSPPYPVLLAGLYWLFGVKSAAAHLAAQVINSVIGAATIPLLYLAVRRVGGHASVALVAAALLAMWATQLFSVAWAQAITLITFCNVAMVLLWYRSIDTGELRSWLGFGVIGCFAALAEPVLLPAMVLAGALILTQRSLAWPLRLRNAAILLVCAVSIIGPWTYRNWRVHGAIVPVTSTFWLTVWKGNNAASAGTDRPALTPEQLSRYQVHGQDNLRQYDLLTDAQRQELDGKRAIEREATWKRYATTFIRENPGRYAELCGLRLVKTLWADWDNPKSHDRLYVYFTSRSTLLAGTLAGLLLALRQRWRMGFPLLIVGTSLGIYTLTITSARFAFPMEPFQIALTSLAILTAWKALFGARERPPMVRHFTGSLNDGDSHGSLTFQDR